MRLNSDLLKSFRASKDLTLREAAKLAGVSYQTWFQWETHGYMPESKNLSKLAKVLRIPEIRLLVQDGKGK